MPRFDAKEAQCWVFVTREGVLAAVGHDLRLAFGEFEVTIDDATHAVRAELRMGSLTVASARKHGQDAPGALGSKDIAEIERNLRGRAVLDVARHAVATFSADRVEPTDGGWSIPGELRLRGLSQPVLVEATRRGSQIVATASFRPSDFGIEPFRGMLGALRTKDLVSVEVRMPDWEGAST